MHIVENIPEEKISLSNDSLEERDDEQPVLTSPLNVSGKNKIFQNEALSL